MTQMIGGYKPQNTYLKRQRRSERIQKAVQGAKTAAKGTLLALGIAAAGALVVAPERTLDNRVTDVLWDPLYRACELADAPEVPVTVTDGMTVDGIAGIAGAPVGRRDEYAQRVAEINGLTYDGRTIMLEPGQTIRVPDPRGYLTEKLTERLGER